MVNTVLITCVDEMLICLMKIIHQASEKLLGLQLDPATEPKTLHLATRACAIHAANLRNLTQLRKLLLSPAAAAGPPEDPMLDLVAMMDVAHPAASCHPPTDPVVAPPVPDRAPSPPAGSGSVPSKPRSPVPTSSAPAPASASSPPPPAPAAPARAAPICGPSGNPSTDLGALAKRDPNVHKPASAHSGQFPPPPRPPAGWYPG